MVIGEVVGRLWASRQAGTLAGRKLLLVRPLGATGRSARVIVVVDALDAGPGDRVLVARGSRVASCSSCGPTAFTSRRSRRVTSWPSTTSTRAWATTSSWRWAGRRA